jgi:hypothetical protein
MARTPTTPRVPQHATCLRSICSTLWRSPQRTWLEEPSTLSFRFVAANQAINMLAVAVLVVVMCSAVHSAPNPWVGINAMQSLWCVCVRVCISVTSTHIGCDSPNFRFDSSTGSWADVGWWCGDIMRDMVDYGGYCGVLLAGMKPMRWKCCPMRRSTSRPAT